MTAKTTKQQRLDAQWHAFVRRQLQGLVIDWAIFGLVLLALHML